MGKAYVVTAFDSILGYRTDITKPFNDKRYLKGWIERQIEKDKNTIPKYRNLSNYRIRTIED